MKKDIVIIGTGPGCIPILQKNKSLEICIIEVGVPKSYINGYEDLYTVSKIYKDEKIVREVDTEPQEHCDGTVKRMYIPTIEGSSFTVNTVELNVGKPEDYVNMTDKFSFENVSNVMNEFKINNHDIDKNYMSDFFQDQVEHNNLTVKDFDHVKKGDLNGYHYPLQTMKRMSGMHTKGERTNIYSKEKTNNTTVLIEHEVVQIIFEKTKNNLLKAKSVLVKDLKTGETFKIESNHAVFICMNAIDTPKLLFQSGIGPKESFKDTGIECVIDSAHVGKNLKDLPCVKTFHILKSEPSEKNYSEYEVYFKKLEEYQYFRYFVGFILLGMFHITCFGAFIHGYWFSFALNILLSFFYGGLFSNYMVSTNFYLYFIFLNTILNCLYLKTITNIVISSFSFIIVTYIGLLFSRFLQSFNHSGALNQLLYSKFYKDNFCISYYMGYNWDEAIHRQVIFKRYKVLESVCRFSLYWFIKLNMFNYRYGRHLLVSVLKPLKTKSVGSVEFVHGKWKVNPNYLQDEENISDIKESLRVNEMMLNMTGYESKLKPTQFDNIDSYFIKHYCTPSSNSVGTCKAGETIKDGVVDNHFFFRVHGTSNLSILDSSVFQEPNQGDLTMATYCISKLAIEQFFGLLKI